MTTENVEVRKIDIHLVWRQVLLANGKPFPWHQRAARYAHDREMLDGPQVYRWILRDANGAEECSYIGETEAFQNRLSKYRRPNAVRLNTEKRVREEIDKCERRGGTIELWFLDLDAGSFSLNGHAINKYSLGESDVRRMLESIATFTERQSGRKLLNAIEDNAVNRKLLALLGQITQKQGVEAAMKILNS